MLSGGGRPHSEMLTPIMSATLGSTLGLQLIARICPVRVAQCDAIAKGHSTRAKRSGFKD